MESGALAERPRRERMPGTEIRLGSKSRRAVLGATEERVVEGNGASGVGECVLLER